MSDGSEVDARHWRVLPGVLLAAMSVSGLAAVGIGSVALQRMAARSLGVATVYAVATVLLAVAWERQRRGRPLLAARIAVFTWMGAGAAVSVTGDLLAVAATMPLVMGVGIGLATLFDARAVMRWSLIAGLLWICAIRARPYLLTDPWPEGSVPIGLVAYIPALCLLLLGWCCRAVVVARDDARLAAEASSRAKSAFLANMSHELRTPLNAMLGYTELVMEDAEDRGQAQTVADLGMVRTAGRHLLSLIDDVLDLSRIEGAGYQPSGGPIDLEALFGEVVATLSPLAVQRGNRLETRIPGAIPTPWRSDERAVRQILTNLVSNACKFTENGVVVVGVQPREGGLALQVEDSGIGMSDEELARVFSPFEQASLETTRKYGGTGLGLTITQRLVNALHGRLDVQSAPGRGTRFEVWLPTMREAA
jgi:signal transduction histidine kinase